MEHDETFPESWRNLRFPGMRHDLVLYLKDLSDPEYQRRVWLYPSSDPKEAFNTLGNTLLEIIDTRGYDDDEMIDAYIGGELFDEAEAVAMKSLCHLIVEICRELRRAPDAQYMKHPKWPAVVHLARHAYELMKDR